MPKVDEVELATIKAIRGHADLAMPEKVLWFEVLRLAIEDLRKPKQQRRALYYFRSMDFVEHAEILGLAPGFVLRVLRVSGLLKGQ